MHKKKNILFEVGFMSGFQVKLHNVTEANWGFNLSLACRVHSSLSFVLP